MSSGSFSWEGQDMAAVADRIKAAALQAASNAVEKALAVGQAEARRLSPVNEGELRGNIRYQVEAAEDEIVGILGAYVNYAAAVENGTKPHWPPPLAIQKWVHLKGLAGTYSVSTHRRTGNRDDYEQQVKQIAFLIARAISKSGTKPHPYLYPGMEMAISRVRTFLAAELNNLRQV